MSRVIEALFGRAKSKQTDEPKSETPLVFQEGGKFFYNATFRHPLRNDRSRGPCPNDGKIVNIPFIADSKSWPDTWIMAKTLKPPHCEYEKLGVHDNGVPAYYLDHIAAGNSPISSWWTPKFEAQFEEAMRSLITGSDFGNDIQRLSKLTEDEFNALLQKDELRWMIEYRPEDLNLPGRPSTT